MSTGTEQPARLTGIVLMLAAMGLFSFGDALGKLVVVSYSVGQLLLLRAAAGLVVLSPLIWRQRSAFARLERPWLQAARIVVATVEVAAFFLATRYLPLADVITYYLASSLFVALGSALFLGETIGRARLVAILAGFGGVVIALQPSAESFSWPALIALGASMAFAALLLITRKLRDTPDMVLASQQFLGTFALGAAMAPSGWSTPGPADLSLFAIAGVVSAAGLLCVNRSLRIAPASVVVPFQYSMIIWGVAFGYLMFGDWPSTATLVGVAVIVGAGLAIFVIEQRARRAAPKMLPPG